MTSTDGQLHLGSDFETKLSRALPLLLATGALPEDWDYRATTYDLPRFDSDIAFARRFEQALDDILDSGRLDAGLSAPQAIRERLIAVGLPFDYARLGQPLSTVLELYMQSRTHAARCFSFASVTKPWLSVIESPTRSLPVRIYAEGGLPISEEKKRALRAAGHELHERWREDLPAHRPEVLTVLVTDGPFSGDVQTLAADAVCSPVPGGGLLLLRDAARIAPQGIQLIRKRTVAALLAADARAELERVAGLVPTAHPEATAADCDARLRALFPEVQTSLYFCTGLGRRGRGLHRGRRCAGAGAGGSLLRAERLWRHRAAHPRSAGARRRDRSPSARRHRSGRDGPAPHAGRSPAGSARGSRGCGGVRVPRDPHEPRAPGARLWRADEGRARVRPALGQESPHHRRHHAGSALPDLRQGLCRGLAVHPLEERLEVLHPRQGHAGRRRQRERPPRARDPRARPRARSGHGLVRASGAARGARRGPPGSGAAHGRDQRAHRPPRERVYEAHSAPGATRSPSTRSMERRSPRGSRPASSRSTCRRRPPRTPISSTSSSPTCSRTRPRWSRAASATASPPAVASRTSSM